MLPIVMFVYFKQLILIINKNYQRIFLTYQKKIYQRILRKSKYNIMKSKPLQSPSFKIEILYRFYTTAVKNYNMPLKRM